jgi:hypothetical protein
MRVLTWLLGCLLFLFALGLTEEEKERFLSPEPYSRPYPDW